RRPSGIEADSDLLEFTFQAKWKTPAEERLALIVDGLLAANASTHKAYVNLIEGHSDIGLIARPPSPAELGLASTKGVGMEVLPVALDALVFLLHKDNPVRGLRTAHIQGIYLDHIKTWEQIGGHSSEIVAYHREENS